MTPKSTTFNRLIGAAAVGIAVGGGVTAAGAATPAHADRVAHHSTLIMRHANEPETSLEATQDGPGQSESSATDVSSVDSSTDSPSSSSPSDPQNLSDSTPEGTSTDSSVDSVTHSRDGAGQDLGLVGGRSAHRRDSNRISVG